MPAESYPLCHFKSALPHRPYCSDDLEIGLVIRGRDQALKHRYVQHSPPVLRCWLVFDIDRSGGVLAWEEANLPSPQISIRTPKTRHGQLLYGLLVPVCTSDAARQGPLRLAAAIERAYTELLEADRSYSGLIVKNPFHPDWATECWIRPLYELRDLADRVENLDKYRVRLHKRRKSLIGFQIMSYFLMGYAICSLLKFTSIFNPILSVKNCLNLLISKHF